MPKSLIFVVVVFIWGSGQVLDSIVRYPIKVDYYLWQSLGLPWAYFGIQFFSLALLVAALTVLFRPRQIGLQICLAQATWMAIYGAISTLLVQRDIAGVREIYIAGREVRGLSVRPEAADMIFTPIGIWSSYGFIVLFACVVAVMLWRKRSWFYRDEQRAT